MDETLKKIYGMIPRLPQRQDSLAAQFADLKIFANSMGMYDAADAISQWIVNMPKLKFGCYCDLEEGHKPDECVINLGKKSNCIYAKNIERPEQCEYWRPISNE